MSSQAEAGDIKRVNSDADLIRPHVPLQQIQIHALEGLLLRQPLGFVCGAHGVRVIHRLETFCSVHVAQDELLLLEQSLVFLSSCTRFGGLLHVGQSLEQMVGVGSLLLPSQVNVGGCLEFMTISWPAAVVRCMRLGVWHSWEWRRLLLTILAQNRIMCSKRNRIRLLAGGWGTNVKAVRDASTVQTSAPPGRKRSILLFMLSLDVVSKVKESCRYLVSFSVRYRTFSEIIWLHRLPSPARSGEDGVRVIDTIEFGI